MSARRERRVALAALALGAACGSNGASSPDTECRVVVSPNSGVAPKLLVQELAVEHVDAHARERGVGAAGHRRRPVRLLGEGGDAHRLVDAHHAERARLVVGRAHREHPHRRRSVRGGLRPVRARLREDSARDLVEEIRRNPGKLNFSTAGPGTSQNMAAQYFMTLAGLTKDHAVGIHYKGGGEVTTAVLGGQVQFACNNAPTVIGQVKAGAARALFVTPTRLAELPDAPSAAETGFADMNKIVGWTALMGPPGLPKEVVDRWTEVFAKLAKDPDWQQGNARIGGIAAIRSPAESEQFMREQYELYDKLITTLGIRM